MLSPGLLCCSLAMDTHEVWLCSAVWLLLLTFSGSGWRLSVDMYDVWGVGMEAISVVFPPWLIDMAASSDSISLPWSIVAVTVEVDELLLLMLLSLLLMLLRASGLDSISAVLFAGVDWQCCWGDIDLLLFSCSCLFSLLVLCSSSFFSLTTRSAFRVFELGNCSSVLPLFPFP